MTFSDQRVISFNFYVPWTYAMIGSLDFRFTRLSVHSTLGTFDYLKLDGRTFDCHKFGYRTFDCRHTTVTHSKNGTLDCRNTRLTEHSIDSTLD